MGLENFVCNLNVWLWAYLQRYAYTNQTILRLSNRVVPAIYILFGNRYIIADYI